jgi:hypothetical protein
MTSLNAADLQKMTSYEVANLADLDPWTVRDEGFRRQAAAEKKLAKLAKQIEAAKREMTEAARIINAALSEQARAA